MLYHRLFLFQHLVFTFQLTNGCNFFHYLKTLNCYVVDCCVLSFAELCLASYHITGWQSYCHGDSTGAVVAKNTPGVSCTTVFETQEGVKEARCRKCAPQF